MIRFHLTFSENQQNGFIYGENTLKWFSKIAFINIERGGGEAAA